MHQATVHNLMYEARNTYHHDSDIKPQFDISAHYRERSGVKLNICQNGTLRELETSDVSLPFKILA